MIKKSWISILIIGVMILTFAACEKGDSGTSALSPPPSENKAIEEGSIQRSDAEWKELYAPVFQLYEKLPGLEEERIASMSAFYNQYGHLLNDETYLEYLDESEKWQTSFEKEHDIFFPDSFGKQMAGLSQFLPAPEYALFDVDDNGIPELLIGKYSCVMDVYTLVDESVVGVLSLSSWNSIGSAQLFSGSNGNYFLNRNGDAGDSSMAVYSIANDGCSAIKEEEFRLQWDIAYSLYLTEAEFVETYPGFSYGDVVVVKGNDLNNNEMQISEDEYNTILEGYNSGGLIELPWKTSITSFVIGNIDGGAYIRSEPTITGVAGVMDDGNKIAYLPKERSDVILLATGNMSTDADGYLWYEVIIPQEYRDSEEQSKYYSGKPLMGWARVDVVIPV